MLMKRSYLHYQTPRGRSLGFSASFTPVFSDKECKHPSYNERGDMLCALNITFCNRKDKHFNKKIAREILNSRQTNIVRVRDLPKLLCDAAINSVGGPAQARYYTVPDDFAFILKRFV